jgi:hypothetical protein
MNKSLHTQIKKAASKQGLSDLESAVYDLFHGLAYEEFTYNQIKEFIDVEVERVACQDFLMEN